MSFKKPFKAVPIVAGKKYRAKRRKKQLRFYGVVAGVFLLTFAGGMFLTHSSVATEAGAHAMRLLSLSHFSICRGSVRYTCVVDGDTIWLKGTKIRIADIDTPEVSEPKCDSEYQLGMKATYRLRDLLNKGPFEVMPINGRDEDRYGRKLRVLTRGQQSIGDQLVSEGLARTWTGRREPWC